MTTDTLDIDTIRETLIAKHLGRNILLYKSTASTNDIAWEYASKGNNDGLVVFAEEQTNGRGRMGNNWLSEPEQSILCSILLFDPPFSAELLALASAVATARAIASATGLNAKIKWPNDIIVNNKKIAGILLESRTIENKTAYVIGIGINCQQRQHFFDTNDLQMPATSIDLETKNRGDRNRIAENLIREFDESIAIADKNPSQIIDIWKQLSTQLGHRITVKYDKKNFSGNCIGVDPAEGLILQLDTGGVRMFHAGQTTIIKHM
jgi:BirA family biotin operon repressor/biotin-[acetyl-CoA-carboxylase] ligase